MLYIDGYLLKFLKNEIQEKLLNKKVSKINQYNKLSFSLFFGNINLVFSINPENAIMYISDQKKSSLKKPTNFLLSLRKYLQGSFLRKIEQHQYDRILIFSFEKLNELGELKTFNLIFEIMGKHSNIILNEHESKIIDLLKRFSIDENKLRMLLPGFFYNFPKLAKKLSPVDLTEKFFIENIHSYSDVINQIEGFGKLSSMEFFESYDSYKRFLEKKPVPVLHLTTDKKDIATLIEFEQFKNCQKQYFDNFSELVDFYITNKENNIKIAVKHKNIKNVLKNEINKNQKIIKILNKDINSNKDFEKHKEYGDILSANLYNIKRGQKILNLFNFYKNENETIEIDEKLYPQENVALFYKRFNKAKRKFVKSHERKQEILDELKYLKTIEYTLENAKKIEDFLAIEDELKSQNYIKENRKKSKNQKSEISINDFSTYISSEGFKILVGKNNKENDLLTFKIGAKNDLWFHAKDIPGSHVIVKIHSSENELTDITLIQACQIAAYFSKGKNENKVLVDYTLKKHVNKPKKGKPGFVTYRNEKSFLVEPSTSF